ncbi:hypothetical protein F4780DRAFT_788018 [Xylariomycetidae sp. FL0641]|nr:hypothetical protein F4780DRAFT_788018 [Xylariomycetidae sp. FL0641]
MSTVNQDNLATLSLHKIQSGDEREAANLLEACSAAPAVSPAACLHRVAPPGSAATGLSDTRFALAFFLRPALAARFRDHHSRPWSSQAFHKAKHKIFRAGNREQLANSLLTGEAGFLGKNLEPAAPAP